ncbi:MAG: hypothetical protein ACU0CI_07910 [Shimia sp.]
MSNDFHWLLKMNSLARRFGDGLKPELEALLRADPPTGTTALPQPLKSAGPGYQTSTPQQRRDAGIVDLFPGKSAPERTARHG